MKKAKERLDAEAAYQMTWKQRLENFWFYYRWHVIGGAAALAMVALFVRDIVSQVHPDYQLGILTDQYVSDQQREAWEGFLNTQIDDRNGDGKVASAVVVYTMPKLGDTPLDPNMHMANMTRLSADLQSCETMVFLSDSPADYQEQFQLFLYNDGALPGEDVPVREADLGVAVSDCPPLAQIAADTQMTNYRLLQRAVLPQTIDRKPALSEQVAAGHALYNKLAGQ